MVTAMSHFMHMSHFMAMPHFPLYALDDNKVLSGGFSMGILNIDLTSHNNLLYIEKLHIKTTNQYPIYQQAI